MFDSAFAEVFPLFPSEDDGALAYAQGLNDIHF